MKSIWMYALFTMTSISGFSQKGTFYVEYIYTQKAIALPDSLAKRIIDVKVTYHYGSTEKTEFVQATLDNLIPGEFSFVTMVYMIANADSSRKFFDGHGGTGDNSSIAFVANTPDTIFYKQGEWRKLRDGVVTAIASYPINVIETNESKDILGYKCIKFLSAGPDKEDNISFWACKELPNTLLPFTGLESFRYGILEIDHAKSQWHSRAVTIRKL